MPKLPYLTLKCDSKCDCCGCATPADFLTATLSPEFPNICPECYALWQEFLINF